MAFQSKVDHQRMWVLSYTDVAFCSCDLDLDLMALIYELDVDILRLYLQTKGEVLRSFL